MMGLKKSKYVLLAACAVAAFSFSNDAMAQTANMTATATVQNTLTVATPAQLNFGTIAAFSDTAQTATVTVGTGGAPSIATTGAPAVTAIVDGAAVSAAQVTIADGADGASINLTINNVVDPINGGESFVLAGWNTSWNGGGDAAQVAGVTWQETYDAAFGGGTNTLDIGATITTTTAATQAYTDGVYSGSFDVVASY